MLMRRCRARRDAERDARDEAKSDGTIVISYVLTVLVVLTVAFCLVPGSRFPGPGVSHVLLAAGCQLLADLQHTLFTFLDGLIYFRLEFSR
jgi:hypothetical protein